MKWLLSLLILFGCSGSSSSIKHDNKITVLSTTAMIHDLVQEIGKEHVGAHVLIRGEIDPHRYELVKGDDEKISSAKIVFYNGLGLEHGASLRYKIEQHPCKVALGDEISKRNPGSILWKDGQKDPHVWMDVSLWAQAIEPIVEALGNIDPEHAVVFRENGEELRKKMLKVHGEIKEKFQKISPDVRYLVTSHDAFNYFTREYLASAQEQKSGTWKKRFAAPEGLAPDGQLSVIDIQKIVDHLIAHRISCVFPESNVNRDSLKKIVSACRQKGLHVEISDAPLYGDAVGPSHSDAANYLGMLQHNANLLLLEWEKTQ